MILGADFDATGCVWNILEDLPMDMNETYGEKHQVQVQETEKCPFGGIEKIPKLDRKIQSGAEEPADGQRQFDRRT